MTITCPTRKDWTPYDRTLIALLSTGWNWFAMFLWVKMAPGGELKTVPSETRESLTDASDHRGTARKECRGSAIETIRSDEKEITNLHPKNKKSGNCPFVARSFNKLGLEEFAIPERNIWFP